MYKNIMIPLGLSDLNPAVLDRVVELASFDNASPGKAKVTLVHVVQAFDSDTDEEAERFYRDIEKAAEQHLKAAGEVLLGKGVQSNHVILIGERVAEVLQCAEDHAIDLIIMESHHINKDKPMEGLGSFSQQIGVLSPCSVLLVR